MSTVEIEYEVLIGGEPARDVPYVDAADALRHACRVAEQEAKKASPREVLIRVRASEEGER